MKHFVGANRGQTTFMPYDLEEWLPQDHLARFTVEIVDKLDFTRIYAQYRGTGTAAYDPKLLLALIFYGYSTGIFSSRKIESATYDSVAFRFIAGNQHPDHDTIAGFRKRFLGEIKGWFKEILLIGKELGLVKLGNVYLDGTKIQANASKHRAMSYEYMKRLEERLESEISKLLAIASSTDETEKPEKMDVPAELKRREDRLEKIKQAKAAVEARASERYKQEKEEYDKKIKARSEKEEKTGKKPKGKVPKEPENKPNQTDQYNFTDPESRIMKTHSGFNQCYNAQAAVNEDMIIVGAYSNEHGNDRSEFLPGLASVPTELGIITVAVADTGYFSESNVSKAPEGIVTVIATSRQQHNSYLEAILEHKAERIDSEDIQQPQENLTVIDQMRMRLKIPQYEAIYKKRKQTVEPVFGIIKSVLRFRQFSLRGIFETDNEWSLVCLAYNIKRMFKMSMTS
ncbi:transposase [Dyadobacter frigoris]|uniref:IS1182 family transposase n=3 Tax=Dyadobacter frigoris TaxID=2576211 RepID=A0A4U6CKU8_9BACT|nr:transposase [Dyadobacter frigoris]TKT84055.1 IS1182 family transposase [Dyadobacter frigoris]GLU57474.1 IS5/IS1182 family transposase [Dyadobacter frigoris]